MVFDMLLWLVHRAWLKWSTQQQQQRQSVYYGLCAVLAGIQSKRENRDTSLVSRLVAKFNMPAGFKLDLEDILHEWIPCPPQLQ